MSGLAGFIHSIPTKLSTDMGWSDDVKLYLWWRQGPEYHPQVAEMSDLRPPKIYPDNLLARPFISPVSEPWNNTRVDAVKYINRTSFVLASWSARDTSNPHHQRKLPRTGTTRPILLASVWLHAGSTFHTLPSTAPAPRHVPRHMDPKARRGCCEGKASTLGSTVLRVLVFYWFVKGRF